VFSISGLHIAVIAGGLHALLLLLRLPRAARFAIELGALWLYVDITGTAPSAVRAFAMVALVETSLLFRVPRNPLAALTASALLVLIFAPLQMFSASFQMSYGIVAALLLLGLPLAERWQAALPLFRHLPKTTWSWWRHGCDGIWRGVLAASAIGAAASLVGAVTGVRFFELLTPGALLENLWLIPVSTAVILMGFIALLCGLVGFTAGLVLANHAAVLLLWGIERGVRASVAMPGMWMTASFRAEWLGAAALGLLLGLICLGYARRWEGWHRGYWMPFAAVLLVLAFGVRLG
jgi:competence protein ComEC